MMITNGDAANAAWIGEKPHRGKAGTYHKPLSFSQILA